MKILRKKMRLIANRCQLAIQGVASIAKAQLKTYWFVGNPENEAGIKMLTFF